MDTKIIFAGIFILMVAAFARGATLEGTCASESVQCELTLKNMRLCNDSASAQEYSSYFSGEAAKWFNVIPDRLTLQPSQCEDLRIYSVANCYADPGKYSAQLNVRNASLISTTCEINLKQGHFVSIDIEPQSQQATQCEEKTYNIIITNRTIVPNQNSERVDLEISGIPQEWYTLGQKRIIVEKGSPQTVKLNVRAPCNADLGTYEFTARASLPNPNFFAQDKGAYILGQGQSASVLLGSSFEAGVMSACIENPSNGKVTLTNTGKLADTFKVSLTGEKFLAIDTTQATLNSGESKTINVNFTSALRKEGTYDFTLKALGTNYNYTAEKQFRVKLQDCYNIEVQKLSGEMNVCMEDKPEYTFSLHNNKSMPVNLQISLGGMDALLDRTQVNIQPGQIEQVKATLDVANLARPAQVSRNDIAAELLIDSSGSMAESIDGKAKMEISRSAIISLINNINQIDLGLRVLGQGELCEESQLLVPITGLNIPQVTDNVATLSPKGKTPLAQALEASVSDFNSIGQNKGRFLIVVSDGKETCNGDITKAAQEVAAAGIKAYTVGFDIDENGRQELQEISNRTGGKYFDARDSGQLLSVLSQISQDLNIVPAQKGTKNLTLSLKSENFQFEKDFTVVVSDCYNASLLAPEINACPGIPAKTTARIINLGSKAQDFTLSYSPSIVSGPPKALVNPGEEKAIELSSAVPKDKSIKAYTLNIATKTGMISQTRKINYLSSASCFGADILLTDPVLDAQTCEGVKQVLFIENRGVVAQQVTISADKPYVHIVDSTLDLEPGERDQVNYFVSPPFDLPQTTFITFKARTNNGFETSAKVKLVVLGNEQSFGIGDTTAPADTNATTQADINYTVQVEFQLYNDSNSVMQIISMKSLDYNAALSPDSNTIAPKQGIKVTALVELPPDVNEGTIIMPVMIETTRGTFTREVKFEYNKPEGSRINIGTGLFSLGSISTTILVALILIVIALIAYSTYSAVKRDGGAQKTPGEEKLNEMEPEPEALRKKRKKTK